MLPADCLDWRLGQGASRREHLVVQLVVEVVAIGQQHNGRVQTDLLHA